MYIRNTTVTNQDHWDFLEMQISVAALRMLIISWITSVYGQLWWSDN